MDKKEYSASERRKQDGTKKDWKLFEKS